MLVFWMRIFSPDGQLILIKEITMQRKPNAYHETPNVILRASGIQNGKRYLSFESKKDRELIQTHEILNGKIIFLISKSLGQLERIVIEGNFDPQQIKTIWDVGEVTDKLFDAFGGGFNNMKLRYFIRNSMPSIKTITISDKKTTKSKNKEEIEVNRTDIGDLIRDLNIQQRANSSENLAILNNFGRKKCLNLNSKINH